MLVNRIFCLLSLHLLVTICNLFFDGLGRGEVNAFVVVTSTSKANNFHRIYPAQRQHKIRHDNNCLTITKTNLRTSTLRIMNTGITTRRESTSLPMAIDETILWSIRVASIVGTYIGLVYYFDRPRGWLNDEIRLEIKESKIPGAGFGLFAKTDLPRWTVLGTYPGIVIPMHQNLDKLRQYPQCEAYIWRFSDNDSVIDPTNPVGDLESVCFGGNPSVPGSMFLMQNVLKQGVPTSLCRINEPPKGSDVNVVVREDLNSRCVTFQVERDVMAGEELYIDYGFSYDRSRYGDWKQKDLNEK